MRLDALMAVAALAFGGLLAPVGAQPTQPASPSRPADAAGLPAAKTTTDAPPPRDPFPPGWTGRLESTADAQREARAAASEAHKATRPDSQAAAPRARRTAKRHRPARTHTRNEG